MSRILIVNDELAMVAAFSRALQAEPPEASAASADVRVLQRVAGDEQGWKWEVLIIKPGLGANGQFFPESTLRQAASVFEGARVFCLDDEQHSSKRDKSAKQIIGYIDQARYVDGQGLMGRLNLLPTGDWLRQALMASHADRPDLFGLSIDAPGSARRTTIQQGGKPLAQGRVPGQGGGALVILEHRAGDDPPLGIGIGQGESAQGRGYVEDPAQVRDQVLRGVRGPAAVFPHDDPALRGVEGGLLLEGRDEGGEGVGVQALLGRGPLHLGVFAALGAAQAQVQVGEEEVGAEVARGGDAGEAAGEAAVHHLGPGELKEAAGGLADGGGEGHRLAAEVEADSHPVPGLEEGGVLLRGREAEGFLAGLDEAAVDGPARGLDPREGARLRGGSEYEFLLDSLDASGQGRLQDRSIASFSARGVS